MDNQFQQNVIFIVLLNIAGGLAVHRESCGDNESACMDKFCIRADQVCDGMIDCPDGTDELFTRCLGSERPIFPIVFHCSVAWTRDLYPGVCPDICREKPDYCSYALMAEAGAPGTCKLPAYPKNGDYTVEDINPTRMDSFSLFYSCDGGYELDGAPNYPQCKDGNWINQQPTCKPVAGSSGVDEDDLRK